MKKNIIYTIIVIITLYVLIWIFTPKPQMPIEYKNLIDSLTSENKKIQQRQKLLDSSIKIYESSVQKLDSSIDKIKEKTTIIREFHHEIIQKTNHYNTTQLDSFFKSRYNY